MTVTGPPGAYGDNSGSLTATLGFQAPIPPPGREWPSFAYDRAHHELVLFGGDNGTTVSGDTWTRRRGTWTQQQPAHSPSPRTGAAMVYDAATSQLVLFGGSTLIGTGGGIHGDTWTWNGTTWTQLHPATAPGAIGAWMAAYDAGTQQVLLFPQGTRQTWAWNGTTWTRLTPATSPPPRANGAMTANTATRQIELFGGQSATTYLNDTWAYNGTTWHRT